MGNNIERKMEISEEERIANNLSNIIKGVFKNAGEIVDEVGSITPDSFVVIMEGDDARVTWASRFVIVQIPEEKPALIEAFNEAIGFQPFCRYIKYGLLVFEWYWTDLEERFAYLEGEEEAGKILGLQRLEL